MLPTISNWPAAQEPLAPPGLWVEQLVIVIWSPSMLRTEPTISDVCAIAKGEPKQVSAAPATMVTTADRESRRATMPRNRNCKFFTIVMSKRARKGRM